MENKIKKKIYVRGHPLGCIENIKIKSSDLVKYGKVVVPDK